MYPEVNSTAVIEGERFELKCEYEKVGGNITWWKINQGKSNISKVIPREKISVKNQAAQKTIEFYVIEKISLDDSGAYRCEVMEGSTSRLTHVLALQVIGEY